MTTPTFGDVFVALPAEDAFLCEACAEARQIDLSRTDTEVWEVGGNGWLAPVVCRDCRLSIPVVCLAERDDMLRPARSVSSGPTEPEVTP